MRIFRYLFHCSRNDVFAGERRILEHSAAPRTGLAVRGPATHSSFPLLSMSFTSTEPFVIAIQSGTGSEALAANSGVGRSGQNPFPPQGSISRLFLRFGKDE